MATTPTERHLYDSTDRRYRNLYSQVLFSDNWSRSHDFSALVHDFQKFRRLRKREVVMRAALAVENPYELQNALLESMITFEECFRLAWIFDRTEISDEDAKNLDAFYPSFHKKFRVQFEKHKTDDRLLDLLGLLLHRSYQMTIWLLPLTQLLDDGLNPLVVSASCKRILDRGSNGQDTRTAANEIHNFIFALKTLVKSRLLKSRIESAKKEKSSATEAANALDGSVFRRNKEDDFWEIRFSGDAIIRIKHRIGLSYIWELLRRTPNTVPCQELYSLFHKSTRPASGEFSKQSDEERSGMGMRSSVKIESATQKMTQGELVEQYREFSAELELARRNNNESDMIRLENEIAGFARMMKQKKRAVMEPSSQEQKVRKSVFKAIGEAIEAMKPKNSQLYLHLDVAIITGFNCKYLPGNRQSWILE